MAALGRFVVIGVLLALGGLANAQTNAPKPNTTDQQPTGTAPSSQTKAQGQPGQAIQEEPVDSTSQDPGKQQGDPQQGQAQQPKTGASTQ